MASEAQKKPPKIFISHSSKDSEYIKAIVNLIQTMGIRNNEQLFCSSEPGYDIPINEQIDNYLKKQFDNFDVLVIFALSNNYYESVYCTNEMGAAWVMQSDYTFVLLPNLDFKKITGVARPTMMPINLDSNRSAIKERLREFKDKIVHKFSLVPIDSNWWENKLDEFLDTITAISNSSRRHDENSTQLQIQAPATGEQFISMQGAGAFHHPGGSNTGSLFDIAVKPDSATIGYDFTIDNLPEYAGWAVKLHGANWENLYQTGSLAYSINPGFDGSIILELKSGPKNEVINRYPIKKAGQQSIHLTYFSTDKLDFQYMTELVFLFRPQLIKGKGEIEISNIVLR